MPRTARRKSATGIYHVILRGINQQKIFIDEEDSRRFIEIITDCKAVSEFKLYAYCLMGNHIHLLIKEEKEDLQQIFKRIGARYVYWYNQKYQRHGHLFQDRFKSEAVEDDQYFLTVLRYIHQNPIKAGICIKVDEYKWSSYLEYINVCKIIDVDFVLEMMGKDEFRKFHGEENSDFCLDTDTVYRKNDTEAMRIIKKICGTDSVQDFQKFDIQQRDTYIKTLKSEGLSIRQISRITGVSFGIVRRI